MSVRMKVERYVVGNHDPLVLEGSSPDKGINWEPGTEIVVTDELAEKFERSGMAIRIGLRREAATTGPAETAILPMVQLRADTRGLVGSKIKKVSAKDAVI